jgi:DNA-binding response OmpR family regulator
MADRDEFSDRLLVTQKGGTFYLKKPVTPDEVLKFCRLALKRTSEDKKIMVVDDDEEFLRNLPNLLQPWGFNLTTLHDSRQFWDVLQAVEPDLLILNPEMPHINGVDLCTVIRSHPDWYNLRILYLSHNEDINMKIKTVTSGTSETIYNPNNIQLLVDMILTQLTERSPSQTTISLTHFFF